MNIGTLFKPLLVSGPGYDTFDNAQAYYAKTFALYQRAVCLAMKYEGVDLFNLRTHILLSNPE